VKSSGVWSRDQVMSDEGGWQPKHSVTQPSNTTTTRFIYFHLFHYHSQFLHPHTSTPSIWPGHVRYTTPAPETMSSSILHHKLFLLSIPTAVLLLATFLREYPLPASKTRTIKTINTLSPTCASSHSLRKIVNPRNHIAVGDSRSIRLSTQGIGKISDEEILARFLKGFFGGWVFTPERYLILLLQSVGRQFIPVGFSGQYQSLQLPIQE
jgi:hypothetical protein